jgi:fimbrial isopeptide formation D2 family protein/uncharacterized repeat protein (TIGR01451 family)
MRKIFLTLAALLLAAAVAAPPAMAVGTLAGTAISNQAYADYKDANSNAMPRVYSNTVTTTVSQVAGANIVPPTVTSTGKNGDVIYYLVQLFNNGNAKDTQTFKYETSGWTPTKVRMFHDVNNSHLYDAGDVLLTETAPGTFKTVNGGGAPSQIDPDDDYDVIMEVTVPTGLADNASNVIKITTTSDFDNTKTATGTYTTTVLAAAIAAAKTHTPAGTPTYLKPGDLITYTITLTNSGSSDGTVVTVTDPLPANVTYLPGSLKVSVNGAAFAVKTDAADNDGVKYDTGTRSVIAPDGPALSLPAGQTWAVQFQATLNAGTSSGSAVVNQASVSYTSGASNVTVQTNGDTCLVSTLSGINLTSTATPKTGNPGDQTVYLFTALNNGNTTDTINLTPTSTQGWTWKLWVDSNGDGIPGTDGDYLLTDTNGDGKIDTGALPQNGTINLLAVATIPVGAANGTTDTITIAGASATDTTKTKTQSFTTTVKAPVMSVVKALISVQAPGGGATCTPTNTTTGAGCTVVPGSVLTYTVTATNSGAGNATTVVLTDITSQYTTYKAGSIKTGSSVGTLTARSDATDGDGAAYNTGSNAVVVPDGGTLTLGPAGTWVLQYSLTVK